MPIIRMTSTAISVVILCACAGSNATTKPNSASQFDAGCPTATGSRIPGGNSCAPGHSYASDDINRTGATTAGGALRLLDPSLTVH